MGYLNRPHNKSLLDPCPPSDNIGAYLFETLVKRHLIRDTQSLFLTTLTHSHVCMNLIRKIQIYTKPLYITFKPSDIECGRVIT